MTYLLLGFEDVAPEHVALSISGNITEDFQVLRVVRHIEDPVKARNGLRTRSQLLKSYSHRNFC